MCEQVSESRLSKKGEVRVSMQLSARVWSCDRLRSATMSVCRLWKITQLLVTDHFLFSPSSTCAGINDLSRSHHVIELISPV